MAEQRQPILKYTESFSAVKGTSYSGASFDLGNVFQMKTKEVNVIMNSNGVGFSIGYDSIVYVNTAATYTFSKDCTLAFADMVEVVS